MTPEQFREMGHQLIDWIADYRQSIPALPVRAQVAPGEISAALPAAGRRGGSTTARSTGSSDVMPCCSNRITA